MTDPRAAGPGPYPPLPDAFYWSVESWGVGLRCRPLDAVAPHLFTTRQLALTPGASALLAAAVGARRVAMVTQVHQAGVAVIHRHDPPFDSPPEADALVTDDPDVAVAVRAADCVPIVIADRRTGAVAAVHAGWRGTAARAGQAAIDVLATDFGARPEDLIAAIGPSIGRCCYEVGSELVDAFAAAGHARYLIERWFTSLPARKGGLGAATAGAGGHSPLHLDLAGANRDQLVLAGIPDDQVFVAGLCTAEHLDLLTSFRAEKEKAGRIAGVIAPRPR
jgi:YfiH family protein